MYTRFHVLLPKPGVMTFSVCMPPLEQVLILWDFLLAYGVHLNILCIVAQLKSMRSELLESTRYRCLTESNEVASKLA
jgi:hypothetical protein